MIQTEYNCFLVDNVKKHQISSNDSPTIASIIVEESQDQIFPLNVLCHYHRRPCFKHILSFKKIHLFLIRIDAVGFSHVILSSCLQGCQRLHANNISVFIMGLGASQAPPCFSQCDDEIFLLWWPLQIAHGNG